MEKKLLKENKDLEKFKEEFEEPFSFIENGYGIEEMYKPLFDDKLKQIKVDTSKIKIPEGIERIYWYQKGEHDDNPWLFVGKIKYGDKSKFIYYDAWCDYTGFDCQGAMSFSLSNSMKELLEMAVPKNILEEINK